MPLRLCVESKVLTLWKPLKSVHNLLMGSLSWPEAVRTRCSWEDDYPNCTPRMHINPISWTMEFYEALQYPPHGVIGSVSVLVMAPWGTRGGWTVSRAGVRDLWEIGTLCLWHVDLKDTSLAINQSFVGSWHPFYCFKSIMWKEQGMPLTGWSTGASWACTQ